MSKVLEGPVVIDLLERHRQVPTSQEILARYEARYTGIAAGQIEAAPVVPEPQPEPQPEPDATRILDAQEGAPEPVAAPEPAEEPVEVLFEVPEPEAVRQPEAAEPAAGEPANITLAFDASEVNLSISAEGEPEPEATRMIEAAGEPEPEATRILEAVGEPEPDASATPTAVFEAVQEPSAPGGGEPPTSDTVAMAAFDGSEGSADGKKKKKRRHR